MKKVRKSTIIKSTKPKPYCFILMPFDTSFNDIYQLGIKGACDNAGAYCERVDEQVYQEQILDRIYNQITKADIIIADMTNKNPNVFYEVGYAHAIGKTTILLTQNSEDIPFDLKHFPHIVYNARIVDLKHQLTKSVRFYIENPGVKIEEKLAIEVYIENQNLNYGNIQVQAPKSYYSGGGVVNLKMTFHNASTISFPKGDFSVGIIFSEKFEKIGNAIERGIKTIKLPDNKTLCMLPYFETLFPSAFTAYELHGVFKDYAPVEFATIRVFSSVGTRDFNFSIIFD